MRFDTFIKNQTLSESEEIENIEQLNEAKPTKIYELNKDRVGKPVIVVGTDKESKNTMVLSANKDRVVFAVKSGDTVKIIIKDVLGDEDVLLEKVEFDMLKKF